MAWRRTAARGVVVAPGDRLLLQHGQDPLDPAQPPFWFLPGGGIDDGETPAEALRRELLEECGLRDLEVGPLLWEQHAAFRFAGIDFDQAEQVLLVMVPAAVDIVPTALEGLEAAAFRGARWWPLDEMDAIPHAVYPVDLTARLLACGLLGPSGPSEREALGPSGPSEREALGPSGPSEREVLGPSGPSEREMLGPSGPSEREMPGSLDAG